MAAVCEVCGKHPSFGMNVSHSHRRTKRRWNPNIQRIRAIVDGSPKRLHVCTGCIKAGKVQKKVSLTARTRRGWCQHHPRHDMAATSPARGEA